MTFVRPHVTVLVGVALGLVALLFHIIGLSAPGWYSVRLGEKGEATVGLWQYCHDQPKYDCEDVDKQWTVEAWLEASRAFSILGLLALVVCAVSGFLVCFLSQVKIFSTIAPLSALIAALFIFIEFSVFAGEVERRKNSRGQDFAYEYCFGLTIVAFIIALIAALCFFIGIGRSSRPR